MRQLSVLTNRATNFVKIVPNNHKIFCFHYSRRWADLIGREVEELDLVSQKQKELIKSSEYGCSGVWHFFENKTLFVTLDQANVLQNPSNSELI